MPDIGQGVGQFRVCRTIGSTPPVAADQPTVTESDQPQPAIRTVIVDDDSQVSYLLSTALELTGAFSVVAESSTARQGFKAVATEQPELVILDLNLGGRDGIWTIGRLRDVVPPSTALALVTGSSLTPRLTDMASQAGADMVASKQDLTTGLPDALRCLVMERRRHLAAAS